MYLKSIDIVGYKSFAIKTHLDFCPGITGIVGPNGCGKSNIMESVRWCLGETSWKSLRADAMIEVIFSGTEKRPPLSMTEVTLTFDNASSQLPVAFSEVTVTRRIYRSGESAYFLNRTQCRMRDIREMFLDTGVGGEGYAIIDQGGVDFVLRAKPEERRALFEEAAGVSKYKAKREEAMRKLERVEMDLSRLQDSLSLIDEQVRNLDSAARKAKLYKKYEEDLVGLEAAKTLSDLTCLDAQLSEIATKSGPVQETLNSKRAATSAEEAEVSRLELERTSEQGRLSEIGDEIARRRSEVATLDERVRAAGETLSGVDARRASCAEELEHSRQRLSGLDPQISQAGAETDRVRVAIEAVQTELSTHQASLDACTAAALEAEQELGRRRNEHLAAADAALAVSRESSTREADLGHEVSHAGIVLRSLSKDQQALERAHGEQETLQAEADGQGRRTLDARQKAEAAQEALTQLRQRHTALSSEILRLRSDISGAKAHADALEAQGGKNPYWVGAQAVLNAGIEGVVGSVGSLIQVDEAFRPYVEDLLGERLFAVVCEHAAAARAAVEFLQAAGNGRARFLVLSTLESDAGERAYPDEARPLLRHVRSEPRYESAVRFLFAESYTLGKVLFGDHWVCGGATPGPEAAPSLADIDSLRARLAIDEAEASLRESEAVRNAEETAQAESAWRESLAAAGVEAAREEIQSRRLQEKTQTLTLSGQSVSSAMDLACGILRQIALLKEELSTLSRRRGEVEAGQQTCRQAETEASARFQSAKETLVETRSGHQVLQARLEGLEREMAIHAHSYERLAETKKHLDATVAERGRELEDLARRRLEAKTVQDESRQRTQVLQAELSGHENAATAVRERLQEADNALQERQQTLHALKAELEQAQNALHELELGKSGLETRREMLRAQLWDQRRLTVEEAQSKYGTLAVDLEKMESLRKRLTGMGPINLAAPEEYEALSQRQTFLTAQIADITQAKADLKAAIVKINATTRENFRQTFTDTREHFRRLYGVLFEGGEADLVLTNPDDILETGVEIVAQPPGKRLQSISLLSGGEKTMTAIALLFAFFMVRPSPFCMLDEADAALDDANIERFVNMLKEFGTRTQFLIISHNKRTMEAADAIYGVTMEEKGVSQLVSIDFKKRGSAPAPVQVVPVKTETVETAAVPTDMTVTAEEPPQA